ncbi:(p)ppGpp synthetase [Lachnospiraceae bacterium 29-84]
MTNEEYYTFTQPYEDARQVLLARLNVLKHNLYSESSGQPIHNIQSRIKKKESIEGKLKKKEKEATIMNAKDYLQDIAGVRVICYFVDDIYNLSDALKRQSDLIVIREQDYIANPKPNGYRSYHVIVGIPVYCLDGMEYFPVEVQFRTMSMDFWASMEHRILYKRERDDREKLAAELKGYAENLVEIESRFEQHSVGRNLVQMEEGQWMGVQAKERIKQRPLLHRGQKECPAV